MSKEILDGEINLSRLNDDESRETSLPEKLTYNPDLVKVTLDSISLMYNKVGGRIYMNTGATATVEPLKCDIRALKEYGYVMANLLIRSYEISERIGSDDEFKYRVKYTLDCVGKLPSDLYKKLSKLRPILLKTIKEPLDIMGIQVFLNKGTPLYPRDVYAYKLKKVYYLDEYYLAVSQKGSVADIVRELLRYATEATISLLGYGSDFDSKQLNKLYTYEEN